LTHTLLDNSNAFSLVTHDTVSVCLFLLISHRFSQPSPIFITSTGKRFTLHHSPFTLHHSPYSVERMEGITIIPLTRGSRSDRRSDLAPAEFQNVHRTEESTWNQMMELFLTPCHNSIPAEKTATQNGYEIRGPVDVDTCETRLSHNAKPDTTQAVARNEQPEQERDLLDYVFENVESNVCRADVETENETNGNEPQSESMRSLRRDNSLIDREGVEADISTYYGNSPKPRNGDELFVSWRTGKIVCISISKQDGSEGTTKTRDPPADDKKKGNPDLLDYVFQNTESFVCGESITPEESIMDPDDDDDGIIGACSLRDQDPEPSPTCAQEPEPPTTQVKEVVESPKVEDEQKNKEDGFEVLDYVFENTKSLVCGEFIRPQNMNRDAEQQDDCREPITAQDMTLDAEQQEEEYEEEDGMVAACFGFYNAEDYETVDSNHDARGAEEQDYEEASAAENAELVGMVVAPYALDRNISNISTLSTGEVSSQASCTTRGDKMTESTGSIPEAHKSCHKNKSRIILGGLFGRRREQR
jgi:hypothetical protein